MTLDKIKPGQKGIVSKVSCSGGVLKRIVEMGVLPGTTVEVVRVAPLGDPIEIKVRGYSLTLRKEEAAEIFLEG